MQTEWIHPFRCCGTRNGTLQTPNWFEAPQSQGPREDVLKTKVEPALVADWEIENSKTNGPQIECRLTYQIEYCFDKKHWNSNFFERFSSLYTADAQIEYDFQKFQYFRYSKIWNVTNEYKHTKIKNFDPFSSLYTADQHIKNTIFKDFNIPDIQKFET